MVDFVKTDKLALFIDSSEGHLGAAKDLLRSYDSFKGTIRSFTSGQDALNFLRVVKSSDGQDQDAANLIFMTYSVEESQGLRLLE